MGYKLADGSDSSEYKIGDKFKVAVRTDEFSEGSIVEFYEDDWSHCPLFKLIKGLCKHSNCDGDKGAYENWSNLTSYNNTKENKKETLELFTTSERDATKLDAVVVNGVRFVKE